ncbi:MAG TPA: hypothetical protein PLW35_08060 [Verrucomicrobiota bacterium]|nr:hypothetical protein [Verrucomicrobiota bacterium]
MQNPLLNLTVQQLKRALEIRQQIESLQSELDALLGSPAKAKALPAKAAPKLKAAAPAPAQKKTWKLSPAARAKLAALARARWRKAKAEGKTHL